MKNFKLIYSREFVDGLTEIIDSLKKDSLRAAKLFERSVRKKIGLLKQFPELGRACDDPRLEGIRILVIGNYLVLYEVISENESVNLHAFCHGTQDYPNIYGSFSRE